MVLDSVTKVIPDSWGEIGEKELCSFVFVLKKKRKKKLVSWCFEPSQPQRITSGLKGKLQPIF